MKRAMPQTALRRAIKRTMTLIADSGSTKTDWLLQAEGGYASPSVFHTQGISPIHQSDEQITSILRDELLPLIGGERLSCVLFYGSGVRSDQEERMVRLLALSLTAGHPHIEAHSDLLGAARALCGTHEGLACILGTGAHSCLYDGRRIVANTPPLGYILGDEGSGAVLGARFLNALYKGRLDSQTKADFEDTMQMSLSDVISQVYRRPLANRWLASLSPFIHDHLADPAVETIAVDNFSDFIARNVEPYHRRDLPLQAVGSIAWHYGPQLRKAARKAGYEVGTILRSPLKI